jgi:hypothetical protein
LASVCSVNTRQKMHILLGDVVAKTGAHNGPMDVLEQAVVALVGCIEILADAVDVLQEGSDGAERPQLALAPRLESDGSDLRVELADLSRQVGDLTKTVRKLSSTAVSDKKLSKKKNKK